MSSQLAARQVLTLEARNDFGGSHSQAVRQFEEVALAGYTATGASLYRRADGRRIKSMRAAIASFAVA